MGLAVKAAGTLPAPMSNAVCPKEKERGPGISDFLTTELAVASSHTSLLN